MSPNDKWVEEITAVPMPFPFRWASGTAKPDEDRDEVAIIQLLAGSVLVAEIECEISVDESDETTGLVSICYRSPGQFPNGESNVFVTRTNKYQASVSNREQAEEASLIITLALLKALGFGIEAAARMTQHLPTAMDLKTALDVIQESNENPG